MKAIEEWKKEKLEEWDMQSWEHPSERLAVAIQEVGGKIVSHTYTKEGMVFLVWIEDEKKYRYISHWPAHSGQCVVEEVKDEKSNL